MNEPISPPAPELSPEKEQAILRGAATVFAEHGYEGASMSQIAQLAGVSKGSLYNYFECKAHLFAACVQGQCRSKLKFIFEHAAGISDPAAVLRGIGSRMLVLQFSPDSLSLYRVVLAEAGQFPELARTFYESGPTQAVRCLADWLRSQTEAGMLRVPDPEFAAEQFFALCRTRYGLQRELQLLHELPEGAREQVVEESVAMFLARYGTEPRA